MVGTSTAQHTPSMRGYLVRGSKDLVPHTDEEGSLKWLGKEICEHVFGGAILELDLLALLHVFGEEEADVDVARTMRCRGAVVDHCDCGQVVLINCRRLHVVLEGFEKISGPDDLAYGVA